MNETDAMLELNHSCYEMISHCETKSSILSAIDLGIITAILSTYGSNSFFASSAGEWYYWAMVAYFGASCVGSFISLIICLVSLMSKMQKEKANNVFYYKDVRGMSSEEYLKKIKNGGFESDLAIENVQLSEVVFNKYKLFNASLWALLIPVTLLIYPIIHFILVKKKSH